MTGQPIQRFLSYGAELAGLSVGYTAEFFETVPPGAGELIAPSVAIVIKEVTARLLSPRERIRIDAATDVATYRISSRLLAGHICRSDGFFDNMEYRGSPSQELLEAVLLKARDSFEEKKVRHLGLFYANLVFTDYVSPQTAHLLLKQLERLSYRQLCLIALVGAKESLDTEPLRRPNHSDPELEALKREEMDLHSTDLGTIGLLSGTAWVDQLSMLGKVMYDLAGLEEVSVADKAALEETIESLKHST
ncbi:hypothetical protein [Polaromonas sp. JS666]|uniref:hypothetical protein n=1 Tax=Polaromonas sp. (strain JS666 / ATCC BAA-500) TaxID=296591 RepID=UPI0000534D3D|nr:hypothetical protein [Polaromonas sp. JS666]ABE45796.1 hypothetical protein Bpro_3900 [Polaromonas sp. JS666]